MVIIFNIYFTREVLIDMKKKVIAVAVMAFMAAGTVFTACNGGSSASGSSSENESTSAADSSAAEDIDYNDYVTLGEYKGLEVEVEEVEVTDEELQAKIDSILQSKVEYVHITEGTVGETDKINLDFCGKIDGVAFDGGTATGTDYTIGGGYISDLNDQLIGLEVGKEYDLDVTFPEDYANEEYAGKDAVFTVTVNYIYGDAIVPEWNDDFVNEYTSGEYSDTASYEAALKAELLASELEEQETEYANNLLATIVNNCTISSLPESKVNESYEQYYNAYVSQYTYMAQMYGFAYEDLLTMYGLTDDDIKSYAQAQAETEVKYIMVSMLIAEKEDLLITDDEYTTRATEIATKYSYENLEAFEAQYGKTYIMESLIYDDVLNMLMEANTMVPVEAVEEETTTATESETTTAAQ